MREMQQGVDPLQLWHLENPVGLLLLSKIEKGMCHSIPQQAYRMRDLVMAERSNMCRHSQPLTPLAASRRYFPPCYAVHLFYAWTKRWTLDPSMRQEYRFV